MDTSKQTGVYSADLLNLIRALGQLRIAFERATTEVEIRLQRIFEQLGEIDLTLQMLVDQ